MKVKGLDPRKLVAAVALCLLAIAIAVYVGKRTFEPIKIPSRKDIRRYGPGGPPNPRTLPPGSMPGTH